jgi:hypothetical protein
MEFASDGSYDPFQMEQARTILPKAFAVPQPTEPRGEIEPPDSLEARIVGLARSGQLAEAARAAVAKQRALGIPVTVSRGDVIVKEYSDGSTEVVGHVEPSRPFVVPPGVNVIEEP